MDQTVLSLLLKVDKRLANIEIQVYKQNDRINSLEKTVKLNSVQSQADASCRDGRTESRNEDNFINQMKVELDNADFRKISAKDGSESKVRKASSFNGKPAKPLRVRRSMYTVPSDKDEEKRLNSFRRECLSKAIQWNHVDLINASPEKHITLPKWLSKDEAKLIMEGRDRKIHVRRFLCVLRKKEFGTMQEWLKISGFDDTVVKRIWDTFEDFSDIQMNRSIMKCFRCRLIENVSALDVADYLYTADIISSEKLYLKICNSKLPVGSQENLWKLIIQECNGYLCTSTVIIALKVALMDKCKSATDIERIEYESLLSDVDHFDEDPQDLLVCHCNERCSRSFHPVSCLQTMSLAGVYFSPPTQRRKDKSSSSSNDPESSLSSNSSLDSVCSSRNTEMRMLENLSSPNGETCVKVPIDSQDTIAVHQELPFSKRDKENCSSDRSKTLRRKKTKIKEERLCSESSLESVDCEDRTLGQVRNSYKSMTNTVSRRLENKPNVINAQTVYFDTGPKYFQMAKAKSCTQSSETGDEN